MSFLEALRKATPDLLVIAKPKIPSKVPPKDPKAFLRWLDQESERLAQLPETRRQHALGEFLACSMFRLFGARIHWGKWFPLDNDIVRQQYPQLDRFREICNEFDPDGIFRNKFISRTMGFAEKA